MTKISVIGLGAPGVKIAREFKKYSQYKVFLIDSEPLKDANSYRLKEYNHPELYEKNPPKLKTFFRGMKGDILFILSGAGIVSGAALVILEQLKHCNITLIYIKPDTELLGEVRRMQERVAYNVLQEYARSAVFKEMVLISNPALEVIMGEVPLAEYYSRLNEMIASSLHMVNVFNNSDSFMDNFSEIAETARISTLGIVNLDTGDEKPFFPLDSVTDKVYYYGISAKTLESDAAFYGRLKEQIKSKKTANTNVSYGIFKTSYNDNYAFALSKSRKIQP